MKKALLIIFLASPCLAEGPLKRHKDPATNLEFQNVYNDLRNISVSTDVASGSASYIQNSTSPTTSTQVFNVSSGTAKQLTVSGTTLPQISVVPASGGAQLSLIATGNAANGNFIHFSNQTGGGTNQIWRIGQAFIETDSSLEFRNGTASTNVIILRTDGSVNQPFQPSFLVVDGSGASDVTGDATVYTKPWPTEIFDQGGDFASNTFTAPVAGRYLLTVRVGLLNLLTTHIDRLVRIITSNREYYDNLYGAALYASGYEIYSVSVVADMDANDTAFVSVYVSGGTKTVDIAGSDKYNFFSGSLIN